MWKDVVVSNNACVKDFLAWHAECKYEHGLVTTRDSMRKYLYELQMAVKEDPDAIHGYCKLHNHDIYVQKQKRGSN